MIADITLGGATVYPYIGVAAFQEQGDGILFYNLLRRKAPDYHLTHKACPVILGGKWICNKWIGYKSQWKKGNVNCAVTKDARFYPPFRNKI